MIKHEQEVFLNRIAARLGRPRRRGVTPPRREVKPYAHLHRGLDQEALIQQFIENLRMLRTDVLRVSSQEIGEAFASIMKVSSVRSAIYWDDERLHAFGLAAHLEAHGIVHRAWDTAADAEELRRYASGADMGIAYAEMGLSETGTVLLWNGGGKGRLVSLLPPVFVAVLSESTIVPRLTEAMSYVQKRMPNGLPACLNFITGPSRTGDIEMDLAFGVHGPGTVHIILVKE